MMAGRRVAECVGANVAAQKARPPPAVKVVGGDIGEGPILLCTFDTVDIGGPYPLGDLVKRGLVFYAYTVPPGAGINTA